MKKTLSMSFVLALVMAIFCSCTETKQERSNTPICNYLYGVEYDDYDFQAGVNFIEKKYKPAAAACSEVRKGNFVGRNLDWYINCDAAFVIKINHTDDHYASIGMGGCLPAFNDSLASAGGVSPVYGMLPMATCDGINEKGVYIGVNVMPTGETSFDQSKWNTGAWGNGAAYTNPSSDKTYCVSYLTRVILDHASSLADAKQLVESINWYEPLNFPHEGGTQAFHWLISDSVSSAVLEFIDNKPCFTETTNINEPSYATIMTNFTNKLMADEQLVQTTGCGYERWDLLHDSYADTPESFEGMQNLMQKVWYTKAYTTKIGDGFFFSEFVSPEFPAQEMYHNPDYKNNEAFAEMFKAQKALFDDKSNWHTPTSTLWYTTHTVIYDMQKRELRVMVHEGLDGQKEYYKASLSESSFVKPVLVK